MKWDVPICIIGNRGQVGVSPSFVVGVATRTDVLGFSFFFTSGDGGKGHACDACELTCTCALPFKFCYYLFSFFYLESLKLSYGATFGQLKDIYLYLRVCLLDFYLVFV